MGSAKNAPSSSKCKRMKSLDGNTPTIHKGNSEALHNMEEEKFEKYLKERYECQVK